MLVSSSEGFAREGLFAAILLMALMVAVRIVVVSQRRESNSRKAEELFRGSWLCGLHKFVGMR